MIKKVISIIFCAIMCIFAVSCDIESLNDAGTVIKDKAKEITEDMFDLEEPDKFELDGSVHSIKTVLDIVVSANCPYEGTIPMGTVKSSSPLLGDKENAIMFFYAASGKLLYITSTREEDKFYKGSHVGMNTDELTESYGDPIRDENDMLNWYFKEDGQKCDDAYSSDFGITAHTDDTGKITEISLMDNTGLSDMIP